jgi:hypothetical protein
MPYHRQPLCPLLIMPEHCEHPERGHFLLSLASCLLILASWLLILILGS